MLNKVCCNFTLSSFYLYNSRLVDQTEAVLTLMSCVVSGVLISDCCVKGLSV